MEPLHAKAPGLLRAELHYQASQSAAVRYCYRLHAVLLVAEGRTCYEVARWLGQSPRTVERWVGRYGGDGIDALRDADVQGRPSLVSDNMLRVLERDLRCSPAEFGYRCRTWTGHLLVEHVRIRFAVRISVRQAQRLKRRLRNDSSARDVPRRD